jgi:hypothetical protein
MAQPTKKKAIELIEASKKTHEHSVAWHIKHPGEDYPSEWGSLRFHQKCIEEYDYVLEYLRRSRKGKAPRA